MRKVSIGSSFEFAEIHYDMLLRIQAINVPLTIASFYGPPDLELYRALSKTYASMQHFRDIDVCVFTINCIQLVVMMAPDTRHSSGKSNRWFLMEKLGLKISSFLGLHEDAK